MRPLRERLPEPYVIEYARVNKFAEVTLETNLYSVPTRCVSRDALARIYDDYVLISIEGVDAVRHKRSVGKHCEVIDPMHYVDLISHKHRAALHALAFADERLPRPLISFAIGSSSGMARRRLRRGRVYYGSHLTVR